MKCSWNSCAKHHEIQHLLITLDKLGEDFGHNRDTYYSLGRNLGYTDLSLLRLEAQTNPLSWILCETIAKKFSDNVPEFVFILEHYFIKYGLWDNFQHFIFRNGFTSLLSSSYWKLY